MTTRFISSLPSFFASSAVPPVSLVEEGSEGSEVKVGRISWKLVIMRSRISTPVSWDSRIEVKAAREDFRWEVEMSPPQVR